MVTESQEGGAYLKQSKEMFGTDDWLSKEIERESRISAWDMDEGKEVRKRHEENCDARNESRKHQSFHQATQHTVTTRENKKKKTGNTAKMILGAIFAMTFLAPLSPALFFIAFVAIFGFVILTIIKQFNNGKGE